MNPPSAPASAKRTPRRWLPYVIGAVVLTLIVLGLRPKPAQVETARAAYGPLRATVSEEGKTRIRQRYVVAAPVTGQLRRIPFKPGAEITANATVVATIDPLPASPLDARNRALASARRDSARTMLDKSRTAHELAKSEVRRIEQMFAAQTVSPQDLESAQLRETAAAREVASAEGTLAQAEAELADAGVVAPASSRQLAAAPIEVRSPVSGRVLRVFQESERAVSSGTPLVEIGDPADLEVVIEMLSRDGAAIPPGAPVLLEQWGGAAPLEGRVRLIEPAAFTKISALGVEEQRVNVVVDITTPLEQRPSLGDHFRVEARVIVWEDARALKIPSSGLFRRANDWAAFIVRDGTARLVPVKTGRSSGAETQVLSGLAEGDEVILYPGDRIHDGQRVSRRCRSHADTAHLGTSAAARQTKPPSSPEKRGPRARRENTNFHPHAALRKRSGVPTPASVVAPPLHGVIRHIRAFLLWCTRRQLCGVIRHIRLVRCTPMCRSAHTAPHRKKIRQPRRAPVPT